MASLISIAEYKVWAGISGTAQDALLTVLVDAVSMEVRRLCDRNLTNGFESTSRTERYDGTDEATIQLIEWPVSSITSVTLYTAGGDTEVLDSDTYRVNGDSGVLSRIDPKMGRFPVTAFGTVNATFSVQPWFDQGFDNVEVVYTGGYATIPADIKMACYRLTDLAYAARGRNMGIQSESLGGYSYTNMDPAKTTAIKAELIRAYNTGRA
jgi:uncharacterized phiE125 gp8 family phage protein